ncbi:MAG: hypothetical protein QW728_00140 [Thermoplasmata archaeon]
MYLALLEKASADLKSLKPGRINRNKLKEIFFNTFQCRFVIVESNLPVDALKSCENMKEEIPLKKDYTHEKDSEANPIISLVSYSPVSDKITIKKGDISLEIKSRISRKDVFQYQGGEYILHTTPITGKISVFKNVSVHSTQKCLPKESLVMRWKSPSPKRIREELLLGRGKLCVDEAYLETLQLNILNTNRNPEAAPDSGINTEFSPEPVFNVFPEILLATFIRHQRRLKLNHF